MTLKTKLKKSNEIEKDIENKIEKSNEIENKI
jgi:hypothetical protein